jgi:WD40 repeat protein
MPFEPDDGGVHSFAVSPDESTVMTGGADGKVQFWQTATGQPFGESPKHRGGAWAVAISSDGERAVSGGLDGGVTLWNVRTGRPLRTLPALGMLPFAGRRSIRTAPGSPSRPPTSWDGSWVRPPATFHASWKDTTVR